MGLSPPELLVHPGPGLRSLLPVMGRYDHDPAPAAAPDTEVSGAEEPNASKLSSQLVGTLTELENKLLLETARKMKLEDVRNSFRQNVIPDDMEHISSIA